MHIRPRLKKSSRLKVRPTVLKARNWTEARLRAARYNRRSALGLFISFGLILTSLVLAGLWLSGYGHKLWSDVSQKTEEQLVGLGFTIKSVDLHGVRRADPHTLLAAANITKGAPSFSLDLKAARQRIESVSWVEKALVKRLWPDRIAIYIREREPLALWQNQGNFFVLDKKGLYIKDADPADFAFLPLTVGKGVPQAAPLLLEELGHYPEIKENLKALVRVGERRWDLVFLDNLRVALPAEDEAAALELLSRLHHQYNVLDLDVERLDLRFKENMVVRMRPSAEPVPESQNQKISERGA